MGEPPPDVEVTAAAAELLPPAAGRPASSTAGLAAKPKVPKVRGNADVAAGGGSLRCTGASGMRGTSLGSTAVAGQQDRR